MGKHTVIIACVAALNERQEKGMLRLIRDIENEGLTVLFWSDKTYGSFSANCIRGEDIRLWDKVKNIGRIVSISNRLKREINSRKWIVRLKRWLNDEDIDTPEERYNKYLKETINVLSVFKPELVICWNPYCCRYGVAYDAVKVLGIPSGAIEWGFLPETFILDKGGTLASSDLLRFRFEGGRRIEEYEKEGQIVFEELKGLSLSLYSQKELQLPGALKKLPEGATRILLLGIDELDSGAYPADLQERFGLLPFHTSSYEQALSFALADRSFFVVYKPHPSHNSYPEDCQVRENMFIVNSNPDELIEWADVVVCSGSKMEFSVLMKDKPLINVGAGLLFGRGCTYEIHNPKRGKDVVREAKVAGLQSSQIESFKRLLGFLKLDYLYSYSGSDNNKDILSQSLSTMLKQNV